MSIKKVGVYLSCLTAAITIIGSLYFLDIKWEESPAIDKLQGTVIFLKEQVNFQGDRLDQKLLQDRTDWVQERIFLLEDRHTKIEMPQTIKEEYRKLKIELKLNLDKLKSLWIKDVKNSN